MLAHANRQGSTLWGAAFALKSCHDEVLSHGSPPVRYVRA
jgi:uncharacterized protein (DUF885 family)